MLHRLLSPDLARRLEGVDLSRYFGNEVEALRVATRALRQLSAIEEVHGVEPQHAVDKSQCERLYVSSFPSADEREDLGLIQSRRVDMDRLGSASYRKRHRAEWNELAARYGDSRFHHLALVDRSRRVVGQRQFSVVPVGTDAVAVYSQYTSVASRRQMTELYGAGGKMRQNGMLTLLHALSLALAEKDAAQAGRSKVVGTYFESEMKGQGATADEITFTYDRQRVHNKVGAKVMLLERADGTVMTPHCQPALGEGVKALLLHFMVRFPKYAQRDIDKVVRWTEPEELALARDLVESFFANFEREGFPREDVDAARALIAARFADAVAVVFTPPDQTPDMVTLAAWDPELRTQVEADYGPIAEHAAAVATALRERRTESAASPQGAAAASSFSPQPLDRASLEQACALLERVFPGEGSALGLRASLDPSQQAELARARKAQGLPEPQGMRYFVAKDPSTGALLGISGLYTTREDEARGAACLGWTAVSPEARGLGLGSALLDHAINEARAAGFTRLRLYTSDSDSEATAQHLYEARGLAITGYAPRTQSGEKLVFREGPL